MLQSNLSIESHEWMNEIDFFSISFGTGYAATAKLVRISQLFYLTWPMVRMGTLYAQKTANRYFWKRTKPIGIHRFTEQNEKSRHANGMVAIFEVLYRTEIPNQPEMEIHFIYLMCLLPALTRISHSTTMYAFCARLFNGISVGWLFLSFFLQNRLIYHSATLNHKPYCRQSSNLLVCLYAVYSPEIQKLNSHDILCVCLCAVPWFNGFAVLTPSTHFAAHKVNRTCRQKQLAQRCALSASISPRNWNCSSLR